MMIELTRNNTLAKICEKDGDPSTAIFVERFDGEDCFAVRIKEQSKITGDESEAGILLNKKTAAALINVLAGFLAVHV